MGSGQLSRSAARADSSPDSLFVSVAGRMDVANLSWNAVNSSPIKKISVSVSINPVHVILGTVPPSGIVDLFCIDTGSNSTCLTYTVNGAGPLGYGGYTGLYVGSVYNGNSVVSGGCSIASGLTDSIWNTVQIDVDLPDGTIQVRINGAVVASPATQPSCAGKFSPDTVAKITVGPAAYEPAFGWSGYIDNVQATITR